MIDHIEMMVVRVVLLHYSQVAKYRIHDQFLAKKSNTVL